MVINYSVGHIIGKKLVTFGIANKQYFQRDIAITNCNFLSYHDFICQICLRMQNKQNSNMFIRQYLNKNIIKIKNHTADMSNHLNPQRRPSKLNSKSPHQVPILAPEQIQKLQILKRASIHNEHHNSNRRSIRPSQHQKCQNQHKYSLKPLKDNTNDSQDTKLMDDNTVVRKKRVVHEEQESNGGGCCNLFQKEEKYDNPFKLARKTIHKN